MPSPLSYRQRDYRRRNLASGLAACSVRVEESDLYILTDADAGQGENLARERLLFYRQQLERYIQRRPEFLTSLVPLEDDKLAPPLIRDMLAAASLAEVGPMAAVAGAVAEYVGRDLLAAGKREVVIENGGDVFLARRQETVVEIFAADSLHSGRVGVKLAVAAMPAGLCTSSATIGHSLSFGSADAATVLADSAVLADAAATRLGNMIGPEHGRDCGIAAALQQTLAIPGVRGVLAIRGKLLGAAGLIDLVSLAAP
ncbi:MAG: UPF0280 family protein [Desulfobulbaceae bacterium]|jgi:ApbE superfamily uncharacterized protein (UPF0280 family)|nr:UPF0280 family protein [Desulfobulbaceae bacterium]